MGSQGVTLASSFKILDIKGGKLRREEAGKVSFWFTLL